MKSFALAATFLVLSAAAAAAELVPQPWSSDLNRPERWQPRSSGSLEKQVDADGRTMTFHSKSSGGDFWVYPILRFREEESLENAEAIRFEIKAAPESVNAGFRCSYLQLAPAGQIAYPAPDTQWRSITVPLNDPDVDAAEAGGISIGVNPLGSDVTFSIRNIEVLVKPEHRTEIQQSWRTDVSAVVHAAAPGAVFIAGEAPQFTIESPAPGLRYSVRDWKNKPILEGEWPENGAAPLILPPFHEGYYFLSLSAPGVTFEKTRSFAVVVDPAKRIHTFDTFFATDTAQSWLAGNAMNNERFSGNGFELVSDLVRLAGFTHVRERMSWNDVNPTPDQYNWGVYMTNADLLHDRGVRVSGMYHDAPQWAKTHSPKLPDDLLATYEFARKLAQTFKGKMGDWEFWNEQDIGFAPEPGWDYVAALKAAYLGFKAGDPDLPVLAGAVCRQDRNTYDEVCYANDQALYTDGMNFHTYAALSDYPHNFAELRDFMRKQNIADRAIWVTECGTDLEKMCEETSFLREYGAHSPAQEMIVAEFYPKSQILLMMEGVARNYFFVFPPYSERGGVKDWGIMRRDATVKPGFAAFSTMTSLLNRAKLLGEIKVDPKLRVFLFEQPDGSQTVAFWTISNLDTADISAKVVYDGEREAAFTLTAADGNYRVTDMMGQTRTVTAEGGKLPLQSTRYIAYVEGLKNLKADVAPVPAGKILPPDDGGIDRTVIVKTVLDPADFQIGGLKSIAEMPNATGKMKLQIWNLDAKTKRGTLDVKGGTLEGVPAEIELPAFGKAEYDVVFHPEFAPGRVKSVLEIVGVFDGKRSSKYHMPLFFDSQLTANTEEVAVDISDPARWRKNSSAETSSITFDEQEQAIRFDGEWARGVDMWMYPELVLDLPAESMRGAVMVTFDIKAEQNKVENDFKYVYLMLVDSDTPERGNTEMAPFQPPSAQWETRRCRLADVKMPLESVKMIRLGANPNGNKLTYWVKNLKIIRLKQ